VKTRNALCCFWSWIAAARGRPNLTIRDKPQVDCVVLNNGRARGVRVAGSMAVVTSRGQVYGSEGLFVVDASIMPTIPAANTNLPTLMLAERYSAWLLEDR
jgi:choline dehydrogenase-like flavoprotein